MVLLQSIQSLAFHGILCILNYLYGIIPYIGALYIHVGKISWKASMKLVNSTNVGGRLVVHYNNTWGTVCDEGWDIRDAHVVCRMLGFHHAIDAKSAAFFGEGAGPVWLSNLQCSGNESDISACSHSGWGVQNCGHNRDVGVVCTGEMLYLHFLYTNQVTYL